MYPDPRYTRLTSVPRTRVYPGPDTWAKYSHVPGPGLYSSIPEAPACPKPGAHRPAEPPSYFRQGGLMVTIHLGFQYMVSGPAGNRRFFWSGRPKPTNIDDFWPAQKPCIKIPSVYAFLHAQVSMLTRRQLLSCRLTWGPWGAPTWVSPIEFCTKQSVDVSPEVKHVEPCRCDRNTLHSRCGKVEEQHRAGHVEGPRVGLYRRHCPRGFLQSLQPTTAAERPRKRITK
jgi:hypothetical protein